MSHRLIIAANHTWRIKNEVRKIRTKNLKKKEVILVVFPSQGCKSLSIYLMHRKQTTLHIQYDDMKIVITILSYYLF